MSKATKVKATVIEKNAPSERAKRSFREIIVKLLKRGDANVA